MYLSVKILDRLSYPLYFSVKLLPKGFINSHNKAICILVVQRSRFVQINCNLLKWWNLAKIVKDVAYTLCNGSLCPRHFDKKSLRKNFET